MKTHLICHFFLFFALFLVSCQNTRSYRLDQTHVERKLAQEDEHYDEIYKRGRRGSKVRETYREALQVYDELSEEERQAFRSTSTLEFRGDNALLPLPRILSEDEFLSLLKE